MKFLVVGIDYFTKWVEAEALATITEKNIRSFVWRNIICRYGIPRVLVSDNGKQFDNSAFRDFCSELGIKNHYSSPAHPQANGQVEVTNRSLLKIIKTRLEGAKGICENHSGARSLVHKLIRAGYYWPTMMKDAQTYVQSCDKCQRFSNLIRQPSEELTPMMAP